MSNYIKHESIKPIAYFICILAALFYFYEFILQISPSVITDELMRELSITATELGLISAFFYYAYTPMQIPAGLLYDRYGPRVLLTLATAICVVGAFLFGLAHSPWQAGIGRACMGVGGAFSFIGSLVLIARWFPPIYFALMAGLVQFLGSIGSMVGNKPLAYSVSLFGWRPSILGMGIAGIVLVVAIWLFVRDYPADKAKLYQKSPRQNRRFGADELQRLKMVLSKKQTWIIALYSLAIWAPILCFAGLWGVPFLKEKYGINDVAASGFNMYIWLGVALASPAIGYVSNRIRSRVIPLYVMALLGLAVSIIILYMPNIPHVLQLFLLLCYGFAASGQALAFAVINDISERELVGTAIGFNNMATVAGGAFLQPLIGRILDWRWDGSMINGVPHYDLSMYQAGLSIAPICFLFCFVLSYWFIEETDCELKFPINNPSSLDKTKIDNTQDLAFAADARD